MDELRSLLLSSGLISSPETADKMETYQSLLLDWNQRMDLTSVKSEEMAARHFLDSLTPLRAPGLIPETGRLIDVGTGAGFPGLPLAIARPGLAVTLLEAQNKRCVFLRAVCDALSLSNVTILNDRAENAGRSPEHREAYDRAVARAVAPLNVLCEYLLPFVRVGGQALCWKGPAVTEEWADGAAAARLLGGEPGAPVDQPLPGEDSRHVLVPIQKLSATLPQYPRKNGIPAKRPLKKTVQ